VSKGARVGFRRFGAALIPARQTRGPMAHALPRAVSTFVSTRWFQQPQVCREESRHGAHGCVRYQFGSAIFGGSSSSMRLLRILPVFALAFTLPAAEVRVWQGVLPLPTTVEG